MKTIASIILAVFFCGLLYPQLLRSNSIDREIDLQYDTIKRTKTEKKEERKQARNQLKQNFFISLYLTYPPVFRLRISEQLLIIILTVLPLG